METCGINPVPPLDQASKHLDRSIGFFAAFECRDSVLDLLQNCRNVENKGILLARIRFFLLVPHQCSLDDRFGPAPGLELISDTVDRQHRHFDPGIATTLVLQHPLCNKLRENRLHPPDEPIYMQGSWRCLELG